jgi:hypothetical protein
MAAELLFVARGFHGSCRATAELAGKAASGSSWANLALCLRA